MARLPASLKEIYTTDSNKFVFKLDKIKAGSKGGGQSSSSAPVPSSLFAPKTQAVKTKVKGANVHTKKLAPSVAAAIAAANAKAAHRLARPPAALRSSLSGSAASGGTTKAKERVRGSGGQRLKGFEEEGTKKRAAAQGLVRKGSTSGSGSGSGGGLPLKRNERAGAAAGGAGGGAGGGGGESGQGKKVASKKGAPASEDMLGGIDTTVWYHCSYKKKGKGDFSSHGYLHLDENRLHLVNKSGQTVGRVQVDRMLLSLEMNSIVKLGNKVALVSDEIEGKPSFKAIHS